MNGGIYHRDFDELGIEVNRLLQIPSCPMSRFDIEIFNVCPPQWGRFRSWILGIFSNKMGCYRSMQKSVYHHTLERFERMQYQTIIKVALPLASNEIEARLHIPGHSTS